MRCVDVVELVTDYAEDRLTAGERLRFELHLVGCGACRAYLRQMRQTVRMLGRVPRVSPPAAVERELIRRFRLRTPAAADRTIHEG